MQFRQRVLLLFIFVRSKTCLMESRLILSKFLYILFMVSFAIAAQSSPHYYFKQVSLAEGLSQSLVNCIYRDHQGILWIGTRNGLNAYDSYEIRNFYKEKNNPYALPDNHVLYVTEDSLNNLWVGTFNGLVRYDRKTQRFLQAVCQDETIKARTCLNVPGGILFAATGKLWKFNYHTQNFEAFPLVDAQGRKPIFHKMIRWDENRLLLGSRWDGLWEYNMTAGTLSQVPFYPEGTVTALLQDSKARLWIATYAKGIYCFSQEGKLLHHYNTANSSLSNDVILDIIEKKGKLWLATDGGGINILDPKEGSFSFIRHIAGDPYSLHSNSIICLYNDQEDMVWAGSTRGGMYFIQNTFIQTYKDVPVHNPYGMNEKSVNCLFEGAGRLLWIGTDGGGLNCFDMQTNSFRHFASTIPLKISSIIAYSPHQLLVSCFNKGLHLFDIRTEQLTPLPIRAPKADHHIARQGISVNLLPTGGNKIYFLGDKICIFDKATASYSVLTSDIPVANQSSLSIIGRCDSVGWLFGPSTLFRLRFADDHLKNLHILSSREIINACRRDEQGNFWIGTNSGLYVYDPVRNEEQKIATGLFNAVSSLVFQNKNLLWIGAQNMLFCYNIQSRKFVIFGEGKGVQPNEFLSKPALLASNGDIFMGGVNGLVQISHAIPLDEDSQPQLTLADVLINGRSVYPRLSPDQPLRLPWNHSSIQIKATTRDKEFFREKRYRYSLNDTSSYVETSDRTFTLGPLAPGVYHFYVQCNTSAGEWTAPADLLTLHVSPPWWLSMWFILTCLLVCVTLVILGFILYIRKKENRHKWEMKEHEQKIYEQKVQFLINISHELRTPLTLIYAPLKRILQQGLPTETLTNQLTDIYKQTKRMKNIINMVLDVRKMELGHDTLQLAPHDVNAWVKATAEDFRQEFEGKGIRLDYQLASSLPPVSFDNAKCEVILSNLLMNALKFSDAGTTVLITTSLEQGAVRIAVTDHGIGLQNIRPDQLFVRFSQGTHDRGGSGIGLSYARILTERHGGKIGAYNNPGETGSTFYYELPVTANPTQGGAPDAYLNELLNLPMTSVSGVTAFPVHNYTLLVVEDETDLQQFLKHAFKEHFKHVYTAGNGREALEIIRKNLPDVIVSDVMMPEMDGYTLCKTVKEDVTISHIPVILLTARCDSESTETGYKTGADAYIAKPFELDFLLTVICNQLRNRELIKTKYRQEHHLLTPQEATFSNADEKFLSQLNRLILEELANPELNVNFLVGKMAFSRASLYNKVKALTDMGINDYITRFRIEKAKELLHTTNHSIQEISELVGYTNQRYFSTAFKQATGETPSGFREARNG